jgi:hypothetical protein
MPVEVPVPVEIIFVEATYAIGVQGKASFASGSAGASEGNTCDSGDYLCQWRLHVTVKATCASEA